VIKAALISDPVFFPLFCFKRRAGIVVGFLRYFIFLFLFLLLLAEGRSLSALVKFAKKCPRIG
jgi:hypothetical protein